MRGKMKTAKEIEALYGITEEEVREWVAPYEKGDIPGEPNGEIIVGRPLKFGEPLRVVGFKDSESKIKEIDKRAESLGMKRSDYLRWVVHRDLGLSA